MAIWNRSAYKAGYEAGYAGKPASVNPYSVADESNFNDWDTGHADGNTDADTEATADIDVAEMELGAHRR